MITRLAEDLLIDVPGCPMATIRDALEYAQRELCTNGLAWVVDDEFVVVGAGSPQPEVDTPRSAEVITVMKLVMGGRHLKGGVDYKVTASGKVNLRVSPTEQLLRGEMQCRPAPGQSMPPELVARWSQDLKHGALYRLLQMPMPWGNPQKSEYHRIKFFESQGRANALYWEGHQAGSIKMRVPRF